jgi:hypothetical protein
VLDLFWMGLKVGEASANGIKDLCGCYLAGRRISDNLTM